jgi:hypothetical protein
MHRIDLVDETFIVVAPQVSAAVVANPAQWRQWWPQRRLQVFMDRGLKGQRWIIAGDLVGTAEIWLETYRDGVILHYYLRADPPNGEDLDQRGCERLRRAEARAWKRSAWALKRSLEAQRSAGSPSPHDAASR